MLSPENFSLGINKTKQEKCGVVALFNKKPVRNLSSAILAATGVQHRGQQGAGIAMQTNSGLITYKAQGLLEDILTDEVVTKFDKPFRWILIHCYYGTRGAHDKTNLQPCMASSPDGEKYIVVHNGEFVAVQQMLDKLKDILSNKKAAQISDTNIFTYYLAHSLGENADKKILQCLRETKGAYSLIIGVNSTIYLARDRFGIRPLFLGETDDGWMAGSETIAFHKAGVKVKREVHGGEILKLDKNGLSQLKKRTNTKKHFCDFELAYFSRPDSSYPIYSDEPSDNWSSFSSFRERCGKILYKEKPIRNASFVVGVPDSGIALATGYAEKAGIPYRQVIIKDHSDPSGNQRLFMRDDQMDKIEEKVLEKISLIPDRKTWQDAVVIIGDDSIVRGKVSKEITSAVLGLGAKEVHWIVGFPPVSHTCHLGVSIRTDGELIAPRNQSDSKKIASEIGATSVNYISREGFLQSKFPNAKIKIPQNKDEIFLKNGGCGGCITGLYPKSKSGRYYYDH